jgi:hypothetical protein
MRYYFIQIIQISILSWKEELKEFAKCVNDDGWSLAIDLNIVHLEYET